jgi:hypothetical protein
MKDLDLLSGQFEDSLKEVNWKTLSFNVVLGKTMYAGVFDPRGCSINSDSIDVNDERMLMRHGKLLTISTNYMNYVMVEPGDSDRKIESANLMRMRLNVWLKVMLRSGWFEHEYGVLKPKFGEIELKEFFQVRSWIQGGMNLEKSVSGYHIQNLPHSDNGAWFSVHRLVDDTQMFSFKKSTGAIVVKEGCMASKMLYEMLNRAETRKVVHESATVLRSCLKKVFGSEIRFRTVSSISEHHFDYDQENEKLNSRAVDRSDVSKKSYGFGKGLERIFKLMDWDIGLLTEDKIKECSLFLKNWGKGELKVYGGDMIAHWYNYAQMTENGDKGTMASGCMRYDEMAESIEAMYSDNAGIIVMIDGTDKSKILGRANLWVTDDGIKFMDRIYGAESVMQSFKDWAKDNGYAYKKRQVYDHPEVIVGSDGKARKTELKITLDMDKLEELNDSEGLFRAPYMDTFKYLNRTTGEMINYAPDRGADGDWYNVESMYCNPDTIDTDYSMNYEWR